MKPRNLRPLRLHRSVLLYSLGVTLLLSPSVSIAGTFAAKVSPPRFEFTAKPGAVIRDSVQIGNGAAENAVYDIRTADWELRKDGGVTILPPELREASCRPWTLIERHQLALPPDGLKRYRFEVRVPEDAPDGECRFAILIAPAKGHEATAKAGDMEFPVAGQLAVIVYVVVGDAKPELSIDNVDVGMINGRQIPVVRLTNRGNAHGRPGGIIEGRDADGNIIDFIVAPSPVLPGKTATIPLWPASEVGQDEEVAYKYPLELRGRIEWDDNHQDIETKIGTDKPGTQGGVRLSQAEQ